MAFGQFLSWVLLVFADTAVGSYAGRSPLCGTAEPSVEHLAISRRTMVPTELSLLNDTIDVDMYIHVLSASETENDELISRQMNVVADAYAPHGIHFNHIKTIRTINSRWSNGEDIEGMKASLRRGSYADLNVYVADYFGNGTAGFCTFPDRVMEGDDIFLQDGCGIVAGTLPGGDFQDHNEGATLVHEIGHWMDLYHTFQGACTPEGDLVDDTPAMMSSMFGGPRGCDPDFVYDTCPDMPGTDPIHNWMNYTPDHCREEFTPGQVARMFSSWETYRKSSI